MLPAPIAAAINANFGVTPQYQRGDACPVSLIADGGGVLNTLGIVESDLELSVELWDSSDGGCNALTARLAGRGDCKGNVLAVLDLTNQPWTANAQGGFRILPGWRVSVVFAVGAAQGGVFPQVFPQSSVVPMRIADTFSDGTGEGRHVFVRGGNGR